MSDVIAFQDLAMMANRTRNGSGIYDWVVPKSSELGAGGSLRKMIDFIVPTCGCSRLNIHLFRALRNKGSSFCPAHSHDSDGRPLLRTGNNFTNWPFYYVDTEGFGVAMQRCTMVVRRAARTFGNATLGALAERYRKEYDAPDDFFSFHLNMVSLTMFSNGCSIHPSTRLMQPLLPTERLR